MEDYRPLFDPQFVGREREMAWLDQHLSFPLQRQTPVFVTGVGGVGKSTLLRQWIAAHLDRWLTPWGSLSSHWLDLRAQRSADTALSEFLEGIYDNRSSSNFERREWVVVLDGAEALSNELIEYAVKRLFNVKRVRSVVVTTRRRPNIERADVLELSPLASADAERLFRALSSNALRVGDLAEAVEATHGFPLAISILARLLMSGDISNIAEFLARPLYDIGVAIPAAESSLVTTVAPRVVSATEALVEQLRKQPETIYEVSSRRFEELVAELLHNMGWRVEVTPATRDGGKDILAFLDTDLGEMLCLVEAKKYGRERKVGVGLVRTLYGTLCDYQANSAMLVTTSSFTAEAHMLQKQHRYQLSPKDYSNVVEWIQRYRGR